MRILLINYALAAPKHGTDYRSNQLARLWEEMGHEVTFVGASYSHILPKAVEFPGLLHETEDQGVRYVLLKAPGYHGSGVKRALNIVACNAVMRLKEREIVGRGVDVVIAGSVYQVDNYPAARVAKKNGALFVRETRDLWPLTLTELAGMRPRHPFAMWVQRAEDFGYRHANLVSTTLPNSFDHMRSHGLVRERWAYLPQCPNPFLKQSEKEIPEEHARAIAQARAAGKMIVIFTGSLVLNADLDTLVAAAKSLEAESVQFLLIGRGPLEDQMRKATAGMKNLQMLPPVDRGQVAPMLRAADIATVGFLDRELYFHGVSPNKMFEYMEVGIPVVFHCRTKADPISESGGGMVVAPENPKALAEAIKTFARMAPSERKAIGEKGQRFAREHHDLRKVAAEYIRRFEELRAR